ncbi:MAG TPA: TIGR03087 family PEP-CTERM/XrtA system glycosyltransferase [Candidatus Polarisedimenticolaceae bacterium]|nr:TIGR03087 family PEP-CTERM/XrtA system glycosyltransferase [Candidatus Polarisedimenticolaceae bacterium]
MEHLVFISQRIPYPPNKGDKIRSWNALIRLAERYRVHVGSFVDDPEDWGHADKIGEISASYRLLPLRRTAKLWSLRGLATGEALSLPYFRDRRLVRWVESTRERYAPRAAFTFSSGVAGYVMGPRWAGVRRVHDMADVDSDKWLQYAKKKSGVARMIYSREGRKLLAFERRVAAEYDATLFVSEDEAAMFRRLAPESAGRIHALHNGVDADYFDPAVGHDDPFPAEITPIVMTGTMDYWPNVDAAQWFADEALDEVRRIIPNAAFYVVGANPTRTLRALGERPHVTVTGRVPDVRPYLAHARFVVAPLRIARGVQNKVLEGMAMARPVLASAMALEGIRAEIGSEVLLADSAADFARHAASVDEATGAAIGGRARARVLASYSWNATFGCLIDFFDGKTT